MIILDTNVISDAIAKRPTEQVLSWLAAQPLDELWTTAITAAELRAGVAALPIGRRRDQLSAAIEATLLVDMGGRILPFTAEASVAFAEITARRRRRGKGWSPMDMLIAATAVAAGAPVATRNEDDFEESGVTVINPWAG